MPYSDLGPFLKPKGPDINIVKGFVPFFKSTLCNVFEDLKPIYPTGLQNLPFFNVSQ